MLSYRHAFHAGNHADVLKHLVLVQVIEKLKQKNKPFCYIDSHSGAGLYDLFSEYARKTGESEQGISKLVKNPTDLPAALTNYINLIDSHSRFYPGSPEIARQLLRPQDKLILMELHNNEVRNLKNNMQNDARCAIHHRDGFEGLNAIVPPEPRRGLVLIDPSYETKDDYEKTIVALTQAIKKWATGIYLIWYPMLARQRDQSNYIAEALVSLPVKSLLKIELAVSEQQEDYGMHGSGMLIVNAPYQIDTELAASLAYIKNTLAMDDKAYCQMNWLIESA
ncbi:23S rRNA (adenine(2030)-N(6))-methyltransferase RlmJ [Gayadomonas joobiniege]|uniref:23S rRNA (adenine(2030)-N(6))-methyltransferase RlmJ n=1 Tax=Gayadomonas joobiniege TaxID=1234606 RepID=UPI00037E23EF|nr:23S rRNA (adenine(2030)-N(6))-methyltransferase RlmJ [Gayadomonas joobiniege]